MIEVQMRRDDGNRERRQRAHDRYDIARARTRIEQHGTLAADDEVAVVALVVAGLTDRERRRVDLLEEEVVIIPVTGDRYCRLGQNRRVLAVEPVFKFGIHIGGEVGRRYDSHGEHNKRKQEAVETRTHMLAPAERPCDRASFNECSSWRGAGAKLATDDSTRYSIQLARGWRSGSGSKSINK